MGEEVSRGLKMEGEAVASGEVPKGLTEGPVQKGLMKREQKQPTGSEGFFEGSPKHCGALGQSGFGIRGIRGGGGRWSRKLGHGIGKISGAGGLRKGGRA
jgi:hypothetical protein